MILERLYDEKLAQASYLVGCAATGEALVIDPNRDIDQYVEVAERREVRITHVTETHIHADFVSGTKEMATRLGAQAYLSDEGDEDWKYAFVDEIDAQLVRDGDSFMVGNIKLQALHTPGHTPEHLSYMVTDTAATDRPLGAFTGDFAFVGAVGRPDLLEKAAGFAATMEASARELFASVQQFKRLPEYLQIWPGHGAGSACGKSLSAVPSSTLGYERLASEAFGIDHEDEFVRWILEGQPLPPRYFAEMKRLNKLGPRLHGGFAQPEQLSATQLGELVSEGALVIDTRPHTEYAARHAAGTISIPLTQSFTSWAGWFVPYDRHYYLIADDARPGALAEAVRDLALIGLDRLAGYFASGDVLANGHLLSFPVVTPLQVAAQVENGEVNVIDVRWPEEWEEGHISGAPNFPLGLLPDQVGELPSGKPLVFQCRTGVRSSIAASIAQAKGLADVRSLAGGIERWRAAGYPIEGEVGGARV